MKLHELSIKRPVAVLMCVFIVLVLGGVSFSKIPVDLMPDINLPIAIVSTSYSGVAPQEIENIVTKPLENTIATVNNMKSIQSISSEGNSIIIVEFNSGTDMDFASLQMREKVDMIKGFLPDDVTDPLVIKLDPNMMPILNASVSNNQDERMLREFTDEYIKPRLERLEGIASVGILGGQIQEIQVNLDPEKANSYGISLNQVISTLQMENLNLPGGSIEYANKKLLVRSIGEFESIDQIRDIPITLPSGIVLYIRDIAEVIDTNKPIDSYSRTNNKNSISLNIQKQTNANTVSVTRAIKKELKKIGEEDPDLNIDIVFDQGDFIEKAVSSVANNTLVGGLLAVLILFVFLKNMRTTFIIATAIPISIIATFVLLFFAGISINIVSLGGLALGVGMLVDNAIVVLENIYRFRTEGSNSKEAARAGTEEVGRAILASTMTTIVVFLPIVFTQGMASEIFKELAMTIAFSLLASLIVALSLVPMLSSKFLKIETSNENSKTKTSAKLFEKWDNAIDSIDRFYHKVLLWVLKHRKKTGLIVLLVFIGSLALIPFIGSEFFPAMDQGMFSLDIQMPKGTLLKETDEIAVKVETLLKDISEIDVMNVSVGGSNMFSGMSDSSGDSASISATLKPLGQRKRSTSLVVEEIREKVKNIANAEIKVNDLSASFGGMGGGNPISIQISGPSLDALEEISQDIEKIVKDTEGTRQVESSISEGRPETQIYINRDKASAYGLSTAQLASEIRAAVDGRIATSYKIDGNEIDIKVQYPEEKRKNIEDLKSISLTSHRGVQIPLMDLASIEIKKGPLSINRANQERYVTVQGDVFGRSTGDVNNELKSKIRNYNLAYGYFIKFAGEDEQMLEAFADLTLALLLAIFLVYMVMAIQFESLIYPFIIMFAVPLAYSGSILGLAITNNALSVPAFIGVIMLAGIVVNNAIVLVDYINTLRERGLDREEAILKAGPTRLRPILMTTLTTILAMIPLALGIGEGAEAMAPMAIVVIFGLATSTILTLLLVPLVYCFLDDLSSKTKGWVRSKNLEESI